MLLAGCGGDSCIWLSGAHEPSRWTSIHMEQDCNGAARMFPTDHQRITWRNQECRWEDELEVVLMLTCDLLLDVVFCYCQQGYSATRRGMGGSAGTKLKPGWQQYRAVRTTITTLTLMVSSWLRCCSPKYVTFRISLAYKSRKIVGVTYTVKKKQCLNLKFLKTPVDKLHLWICCVFICKHINIYCFQVLQLMKVHITSVVNQ